MKILHVITCLDVGGAEMMLYKLLKHTDHTKFESFVVSLTDKGSIGEKIEHLGIPVYTLGLKPGEMEPGSLWKLYRYVRQVNPDLIQGWMYHANFVSQAVAGLMFPKKPVLWNIRQSLDHIAQEKKMTRALIKLSAKMSFLPKRIINNSLTSAKQHEQIGYRNDKRVIIPNGFDTDLFAPSEKAGTNLRSEQGITDDHLLIGLIGRYHPQKDHTTFLKAAALLIEEVPNVRFILAGREVDSGNLCLMKEVEALSLDNYVRLLGERQDIPEITAALDIAVSSSKTEGFPNVIGEAMSCGVPCVVTEAGDTPWLIGDTGLIVPPGNPLRLARALKELIECGQEGRKKLGFAARQRIVQHFSIARIVTQYEELYEQVINN
ncbi:glycosyltransferase family 4 protein [Bacillus songklensis]|uniref:Glycosyltransferase family 4 protein n=1 Tax=Bacillus songklensis TaxID=1069116 RepID=A0ABV8AZY2_9BACI